VVKVKVKMTVNYVYYIKRYIQEFLEALIALSVVFYIKNSKEFFSKDSLLNIVKMSSVIGLVTLILEEYNSDYSKNIKDGMKFTVGTHLVGG
jgi:hypothetical protein